MGGVRWVLLAGATGFGSSGILSSLLGFNRVGFAGAYALVVGVVVWLYLELGGVSIGTQFRRRWVSGLVIGVVLGVVLVRTVLAQPASARPEGGALAFAMAWHGVLYGTADALLLTVIPVLAVYGARPAETLRRAGPRWLWGLAALAASLFVTAAYHLGFAEFRNATLLQPLVGNALITASYLFTGSPLAPVVSHVLMHGAAVWHGMETTVQLPPHY